MTSAARYALELSILSPQRRAGSFSIFFLEALFVCVASVLFGYAQV